MPGRHDMEPMDIATSNGPYDEDQQYHSNRTLWIVALVFTFAGAFAGSALTNLGNGRGVHVGGRPEGVSSGDEVGDAFDHAVGHLQKGKKGADIRSKDGTTPYQGPGLGVDSDRMSGPRDVSRDDDQVDYDEDGVTDRTKKGNAAAGASGVAKEKTAKQNAKGAKETKKQPAEVDSRLHPRPPGADAASFRPPSSAEAPRYEPSSWGPDPHPSAPYPRIAWLMSFPNSGTSYTSKMVMSATKTFTGSNYGDVNVLKEGQDGVGDKGKTHGELHGIKGTSVPILESSSAGPFWADPHSKSLRVPSEGYILTKTHCGAYCMNCGPSKYIITEHMFLQDCATGKRTYATKSGQLKTEKSVYRSDLVQRAVHLIRDPFDNVVSRFHLEHNHMEKMAKQTKDTQSKASVMLQKYTRDREGFRAFCSDENEQFAKDELGSQFIDDDLYKLIEDIPCHADFIRYMRWHNLAFTATNNLQVPTLVMHYEDYEEHFNRTVQELVGFLNQKVVTKPKEFETGKRYREDYFTFEERGRVYELLKEYGYRETWDAMGRYFDEKETGRRRERRLGHFISPRMISLLDMVLGSTF